MDLIHIGQTTLVEATGRHAGPGDGAQSPQGMRVMSKKLFVGGLSWDTNDRGLRGAFERFGEVTEAKVISDRETGRSRGFGFVTFAGADMAVAAASALDGSSLDGRSIHVKMAEDRSREGGGRGGDRGTSFGGR